MLALCNSASIRGIAELDLDPRLRQLITLRVAQISQSNDCDIGDLAHFLVIQLGDTLDAVEAELEFSPVVNLVDQSNSSPIPLPSANAIRSTTVTVGFFTTRSIPLT